MGIRAKHAGRTPIAALALAAAICAATQAAAQDQIAFRPAVEASIADVIVPGYAALDDAAAAQAEAWDRLCEAPGGARLAQARQAFAAVVRAFARVELFRFGPAREDNRFERLFFWPDPRGIGLRQVQAVIAAEDETAVEVAALRQKSVAVQGLLAMDFVLAGSGSEQLAEPPAGFRCHYGRAIAGAIRQTAGELAGAWRDPDGFAALMREAGPDNPLYRSHGEVVQTLLQAANEQLVIARDMKLLAVIGDSPAEAKPRRAPFWRSGLVLEALNGNVEGVRRLQQEGGFAALLPPDSANIARALAFELDHAGDVFAQLEAGRRAWETVAADPASHELLRYAAIPLGGAIRILTNQYPAALGLILGFNSTDGD